MNFIQDWLDIIKNVPTPIKGEQIMDDKDQPEKENSKKYCKHCGRKLKDSKDFSYYDEYTGKPIYYADRLCPSWWCRFLQVLDLHGLTNE